MSDTPISDSTPHNVAELGMLCRRFIRKLNAANRRIKRLEEAGDALRQASRECCDNCVEHMGDALVEWREAKEDKP